MVVLRPNDLHIFTDFLMYKLVKKEKVQDKLDVARTGGGVLSHIGLISKELRTFISIVRLHPFSSSALARACINFVHYL